MAVSAADIERHAVQAWPASVTRRVPGGWLLRATPGLDRARSNNALTPCRALDPAEIGPAIAAVEAFAAEHGIRPGVQVSPVRLHPELDAELERRGYAPGWPTEVLVAECERVAEGSGSAEGSGAAGPPLTVDDHASDAWLGAWARAESRDDASVSAHADTVFARLAGRARFARIGDDAVAIAVADQALCGIYCLAVRPDRRRRGLAERLVCGLVLAPHVYVQVEASNAPALALYARLGFRRAYGYVHRIQSS